MKPAEAWRRQAAGCRSLAELAAEDQRRQLLETAALWESLAESVDGGRPSGATPQPATTKPEKPGE